MAQTVLADFSILKPEIYGPMAQTQMSQFIQWMMNGMCDRVALPPGAFVPFAGFKELSGDLDVMIDNGSYDINKIDPLKDIAVVCHRIKNFGADDLVQIVTGQNPNVEIARQLATYFAKKVSASMLAVLKGVFASGGPLYSSNLYSVYVDTGTPASEKPMTPQVAALGMAKIGDEMNKIRAWVMHSKVVADLLSAGYISTYTNQQPVGLSGSGEVLSFMGRPILMSDTTTSFAGTHVTKYRTFGVGSGALAYGIQKDLNPETGRNAEKKMDYVATDIHYAAHVRGCKWNVTTANPTDTDLETATNWALSAEDAKFVRVVAIDTN